MRLSVCVCFQSVCFAAKCTNCPVGKGDSGDGECTPCLAGYFCEEGETDIFGGFLNIYDDYDCLEAQQLAGIAVCPAGSYCEPGATTDNTPCPAGYYCPGLYGNNAGTFEGDFTCTNENDFTNNVYWARCPCAVTDSGGNAYPTTAFVENQFCPEGSIIPLECAADGSNQCLQNADGNWVGVLVTPSPVPPPPTAPTTSSPTTTALPPPPASENSTDNSISDSTVIGIVSAVVALVGLWVYYSKYYGQSAANTDASMESQGAQWGTGSLYVRASSQTAI